MSKTNSLIRKNFVYNSIYQLLVILIPLITIPYVSRTIGAKGIGIYSYNNSIAYYFVMIAMLGLNNYGNRTIAYCRNDKSKLSKTFWSIYFLQLILGIGSTVIYIIFTFIMNNNFMSWILIFYVFSSAIDINWFFFGIENFKLTVTRNIIVKLISTLLILTLVKNEDDLYLYGFILSFGTFIAQICIWTYMKRYVYFILPTFKDIKMHFIPNLILFVPIIAMSVYKVMGKTFIGVWGSNEEVGFFENSEKLLQIPLAFVTALGNVMLPRISYQISNGEIKKANKYLYKSVSIVMFLATSMAFGIMSVSKEFVPIFFGEGYDRCIAIINIILPSTLFVSLANVIRTQYLIPNKKDKEYISSLILGALICLIIDLLLIPSFGGLGASIGVLIAEAVVCVTQCILIRKHIKNRLILKHTLPYIISGVIMFIIIWNFQTNLKFEILNLAIKIVLGALIYLFSLGLQLLFLRLINIKKQVN